MNIVELKTDIVRLVMETESKAMLEQVFQYFRTLRQQDSPGQTSKNDNASVSKLEMMKQAASDPLYLADLQEVMDDFAPKPFF
ncbi:MAG: hypothetical protein HY842_05655 [Bacteroidetes bacterium]|nr:hypothetical protein [Bacteroidota bacterium]